MARENKSGSGFGLAISVQYDLMATHLPFDSLKNASYWRHIFFATCIIHTINRKKHDYLYFEFPEKGGQVTIHMGDWKRVKSNMKKRQKCPSGNISSQKWCGRKKWCGCRYPDLAVKFEEIMKKEHVEPILKEWEFIDKRFADRN